MVLSGLSPLFILWAIRGSKLLGDRYLFAMRFHGDPPESLPLAANTSR